MKWPSTCYSRVVHVSIRGVAELAECLEPCRIAMRRRVLQSRMLPTLPARVAAAMAAALSLTCWALPTASRRPGQATCAMAPRGGAAWRPTSRQQICPPRKQHDRDNTSACLISGPHNVLAHSKYKEDIEVEWGEFCRLGSNGSMPVHVFLRVVVAAFVQQNLTA